MTNETSLAIQRIGAEDGQIRQQPVTTLTDFLGYSPAGAHEHVDALCDSFTPDMIERMNERPGFRPLSARLADIARGRARGRCAARGAV